MDVVFIACCFTAKVDIPTEMWKWNCVENKNKETASNVNICVIFPCYFAAFEKGAK